MASGPFKTYARQPRNVTVEEMYGMGMQYTNTPLMEGYCKALINFDLKDKGAVLAPRPGYRQLHTLLMGTQAFKQTVHHIGQAAVLNTDTQEDTSERYVLTGPDNSAEWFDFDDARVLVESQFTPEFDNPNQQFVQTVDATVGTFLVRRKPRVVPQLLHNTPLSETGVFTGSPVLPVYTSINGFAILPVEYTTAEEPNPVVKGLAKLVLKTTDSEGHTSALEFLTPKNISPTEAVNYGYNMLSDAPYTFTDILDDGIPAGFILMEGILPYADEACSQLKLNARVGESLTFRLYARYPDATSTYKFRWEVREIGSDAVTVYADEAAAGAKTYNYDITKGNAEDAAAGDFVTLTFQPPYKQFGIVVTAYASTDLTEPVQVMSLASYHMASDSQSSTMNLAPRNYALHTATDMTTWRQRVVLWGVQGAPNTVFLSDINDPTYFPYPNNVEVFDEAIITCVPYLGTLLVFTQTKLYKMSLSGDGLSFTTAMVQDKLSLSEFDRETIVLVQNMVYFKNGNYFYMVVPRTSPTEPGALQLAPISTPITSLLDHFQEELKRLIFSLYNPHDSTFFPAISTTTQYALRIQDYHNYLDGSVVRNVYKLELILQGEAVTPVLRLDLSLNYDTLQRAWTCYIMQGNASRLMPYRQTVTDATVFLSLRNTISGENFRTYADFVKPDVLDNRDDFLLDEDLPVRNRALRNHQYMDTGYRDQNNTYKKRYRELQFKVNVTGGESLQFGTEFILDEQVRKPMFDYVSRHITDPTAPDYGWVYVERVFADPEDVVGGTVLDDDPPEETPYIPTTQTVSNDIIMLQSNRWILDVSQLAHVIASKVRFKVSGKGYSPRFILVSFNDRPYELLSHAWVYRTMNAR